MAVDTIGGTTSLPTQPIGTRSCRSFAIAVLAGALLVPVRAFAAVTITAQRGTRPVSTMYADGDRVRFPTENTDGKASVLLLDAIANRVVILDELNKSYSEITEGDWKRMRAQIDTMAAQMRESMKNMPPEQRKKIEALGGSGSGKPPQWTFESLGQKKTLNGFSCDMYRVDVDGQPSEEDCISPWAVGLVKREDFSGLKKFFEQLTFGSRVLGQWQGGVMRFFNGPGFPISRVPLEPDGKRGEEEQIKSIKRGAVSPALFAIPAGFTKKESPLGAMNAAGHRRDPGAR